MSSHETETGDTHYFLYANELFKFRIALGIVLKSFIKKEPVPVYGKKSAFR